MALLVAMSETLTVMSEKSADKYYLYLLGAIRSFVMRIGPTLFDCV